MKKTILLLLSLAITLPTIAETRNYKVGSFDELDVSGGVKVQFVTAASTGVKVEGPTEQINKLEVDNSRGTLSIRPQKDWMGRRHGKDVKDLKITVSSPAVKEVEVSAGASLICQSLYNPTSNKLDIEVSSGSSLNFKSVKCTNVDVEVSSGASANISSLVCNRVEMEVSSGASGKISGIACGHVEVGASSGASASVSGSADSCDIECTSGASVTASQLKVKNNFSKRASSGGSIRK